ncbi:response regulator transcription factor [Candidatus Enterococcus willemsii]|uniref:DNA-binding response regulator n=1 Tax=Candidatus Enterococcus willemsii TaxID=1857215 RepID=A0ABQ6YYM7_9ENTE|nr:response regulator transcription factor [Enterococcus sp. CU12B]KAF1303043.1 DNA-binding response regulator [Enterococcus sp. CU12B]
MEQLSILLVEDEESLASFIQAELTFEGYQVHWVEDGQAALEAFEQQAVDLILLDWMLPKYDGITVARRIRKESDVPIIMMTARNQTTDVVLGLDTGVDDYLTKPFDIEELFARIRVIERRMMKQAETTLAYHTLQLNIAKHQVQVAEEEVYLTPKEFGVLYELMKTPEEVKTRDELLNTVWGYDFMGQTNIVDVYVRTLRNKLGESSDFIQTVRGVGYVLRDDA